MVRSTHPENEYLWISVTLSGMVTVLRQVQYSKQDMGTVSARDYVIFLSHNPTVIPDAQLASDSSGSLGWFDLGLFGHTHGGQMKIFGSMLDIAEDVPDRYRSGWLKENRVDLLISRGVGTLIYPGRLFCFPQIHYITVTY